VPSVVCSAGAVGLAAGRARRTDALRAGRRTARLVRAPARFAPARRRLDAARGLRVERADDRLFAAPARLRRDRVPVRPLRGDVRARFFRRVLLAIRETSLVRLDAKSLRGGLDARGPSTVCGHFLRQRHVCRAPAVGRMLQCWRSTPGGVREDFHQQRRIVAPAISGAVFAPRYRFVADHHSTGRGSGCGAVSGSS